MKTPAHPAEALTYYSSLTPAERQAVDAHLDGCAECRAALAAYQRQDTLLAALPVIRPQRRGWRPAQPAAMPRWFAWLGNALALGGLGVMVAMFALQARYAASLAAADGVPADLALEPGLSLPPTMVRPPSPWIPALPWIGLALLVVALLFLLSRRRPWPAVAGVVLSALLLTSYVPPLSSLPNAAGLVWRVVGGYRYDPKLPFRNDFLIAERPERLLAPRLDQLIGEVGLAPLDPVLPLAGYEFISVGLHPRHAEVALVTTRFVYADGSSRVYPVPLTDPFDTLGGFWRKGWQNDGLQRLRSIHLELPGQPFATADSPIRLGDAHYLDQVHPGANRLDEANPYHWLWDSVRVQRLVWAPDGASFLMRVEVDADQSELWIVPLAGAPPKLAATGQVRSYGWSPDGHYVVYTLVDPQAATLDFGRPYAIAALPATAEPDAARQLVTGLLSPDLPGLTAEGAWFFSDGTAWIAPYAGDAARPALIGLAAYDPRGAPRPSPDKTHLAFACGRQLCLVTDLIGQLGTQVDRVQTIPVAGAAELAWSSDGARLAAVTRDPNGLRPVDLVVLEADGTVTLEVEIAPRDVTDTPQWTPDSAAIFVQTYPQDGRRVLAVDLPSRQVIDLSREHWDTYFSLAPDGRSLLLNNGRGGFWSVPVLR